ncbi:MAG TPA: PaaI family thioesterase [Drouetiella sp.]
MPAKIVTVELLNERSKGRLPGLIGLEVTHVSPGKLKSILKIRDELLAPNGYLHAASVVALADTSCGYGSVANLPPGATGFTTIELKSNFIGTARSGTISCEATLVHGGKGTQVWDATVTSEETGKAICFFRCTQMILYPLVKKRG